jgi:hypothetical protein
MKPRSLLLAIVTPLLLTACSEVELRSGLDKAKGIASERAAVTASEALRLKLIEEAAKRVIAPNSTVLITELAGGIPGTSATPIDADANGLHDLPTITVSALGGAACLTLPTPTSKGETRPGLCV